MDVPLYASSIASVSQTHFEIKGETFPLRDIEDVSYFDESGKAKRWAMFGIIGGGAAALLNLVPGIKGVPGPIFMVPLLLGGLALMVYLLRPTAGTGLVLSFKDGTSSLIRGIHRREIAKLHQAVNEVIRSRSATS